MADISDPQREQTEKLMRRATYGAVTVAAILIGIKIWAYLATNSVAILSTLVDSFLDLGASVVNLLAVRTALTPADEEHRFGHGKAEALAGLGQSAFIIGSAIFLFLQALEKIANPTPIGASSIGIGVMIASIILTLCLVAYQRYVIAKTKSVAISADSLHYMGDLLVNASVIVAIILSVQMGWHMADGIFAMGIALYISYNAYEIVRASFVDLMDEELPDEERDKIKDIVLAEEGVLGLHDLRTRRSGQDIFIQLHLDLPPDLKLKEAHAISDRVDDKIMAAFPNAEVIIHQDPAPPELLEAFSEANR
ncbi:MAG: cation diffusion facilitator family transporter [Sneathiella sp.]|nr:cation diffusion facilitator family transporter [Sneathiella sp.]